MIRIFDDNLKNTYVEGCLSCLQEQIDKKGVKCLDTLIIESGSEIDVNIHEYIEDYDVFVSVRPLEKFGLKLEKIDLNSTNTISNIFFDFDQTPIEFIGCAVKTEYVNNVLNIKNLGVFDATFTVASADVYVDVVLVAKVYEQNT